jgi:prepilin-type N-terminal cleavage/methylation domain-containing protein
MINKSFTVIELLVVIAIIGVLASIVLVSLSGTRDRAQIAKTLLYSSEVYHSLGADIAGNWNFDEGSGTTAKDSSGYNNHGTIVNGAVYTTNTPHQAAGQGAGKYALSFDGTNDYVNITTNSFLNLDGTNESIFIWIKHNNGGNNIGMFSSDWRRRLFGTYWCIIDSNSTYHYINITDSYDNNWHQVGYTYNNGLLVSYVDGKQTDSESSANLSRRTGDIWLGKLCSGSSCEYYYNGLIDEVQIYSRALTTFEIQRLYVQGLEKHKDLAIK